MSEEQKSFPVRYMPVEAEEWPDFRILDTCYRGRVRTIAMANTQEDAHRIAKLLNESEGYVYEY